MKIWQVRVWNEKEGTEYALYHFSCRANLIVSINNTFSALPKDEYCYANMTDKSVVVFYKRSSGKVLVEGTEIEFNLLTKSTHF